MRVFDFDHAILRVPGRTVVDGLRHGGGPSPDYDAVLKEHDAYAGALRSAGVAVDMLPPLDAYPDALFVEDPALVFGQGAILLRPGAPTRLGEVAELRPALARRFETLIDLDDGHADGGDVLVTPDEVLIGLSARTDVTGPACLVAALAEFGRKGRIVVPPEGALHLKTVSSLIDEETILATRECKADGMFAGFRLLIVPEEERAAANALRVNDVLLVGNQFPRTIDMLVAQGFDIVALDTTQIGLIDAGLSCMSLRWAGHVVDTIA